MSLSGQWFVEYSGNNTGQLLLDIDDMGDHYEGTACLWGSNPELPNSLVRFRTPSKATTQLLEGVQVLALDNLGNDLSTGVLEQLKQSKNLSFPATADIEFDFREGNLSIKWVTPIGSFGGGVAVAPKTRGGIESALKPHRIKTWEGFKRHVSTLERKRYIFRGQESSIWRLRSGFFRTGRACLERYLLNDIQDLQKTFSSLTQYPFDLQNSLHYGAFLNLAQHHGYPTPMLDWTWSPYVAAFFAYRNVRRAKNIDKIRIFKFDIVEWNKLRHAGKLFPIWPNVSILDALAFANSRVVPQQAISTISNIDDIESHIASMERLMNKNYLEVFELPARQRQTVMQDLALMGITAGSLFPGLDGACEALKERNF